MSGLAWSSDQQNKWNHERFRAEAFRFSIDRMLSPLGCSTATLRDGRALHVRARDPVDLATLPHAAGLCAQYLRLRHGEIAVVNEPFAGGTQLSDITFVAGVGLAGNDASADVLLATRVRFPSVLSRDEKLDSEGVRIPPTPLGRWTAVNEGLLSAIAAHPLAPSDFEMRAKEAVRKLAACATGLRAAASDRGSELRPAGFDAYIASERELFHQRLARLPLGRAVTSRSLSGAMLKLALEVREDRVSFDFAGSDASVTSQLTDRATFGVCFAAVCRAAGSALDANAGAFERIEVRSVSGTMVNAKSPVGIARGMNDLAAEVGDLAIQAFAANRDSLNRASSARAIVRWSITDHIGRDSGAKPKYDAAQGGSGAGVLERGLAGLSPDWASVPGCESIERLETEASIAIRARTTFAGSGGAGAVMGGDAQLIRFTAIKSCLLTWSARFQGANGASGGSAGSKGGAELTAAGSPDAEALKDSGERILAAGDTIEFRTAGGGGYGKAPTPAP